MFRRRRSMSASTQPASRKTRHDRDVFRSAVKKKVNSGCSFAKLLPSASNVLLGQSMFVDCFDVASNYRKWKIDVTTRALAFFGNNLGLMSNGAVILRSASCRFGFTIICITERGWVGWVSWKGSESCEVGHTLMFARSKAPPEVRLLFVARRSTAR